MSDQQLNQNPQNSNSTPVDVEASTQDQNLSANNTNAQPQSSVIPTQNLGNSINNPISQPVTTTTQDLSVSKSSLNKFATLSDTNIPKPQTSTTPNIGVSSVSTVSETKSEMPIEGIGIQNNADQFGGPSMTPLPKQVNPDVTRPSAGKLSTFEATDDISEEGANVLREQAKASVLETAEMPNLHTGVGINLLPTKTEEEIVIEKKTMGVNVIAAIAIIVLVLITLVIYGSKVITKITLESEKKKLYEIESQLQDETQIIEANNNILSRFDLYRDIQESTFSPKEVLLYWEDLFSVYGSISAIEMTNGLKFEVDGNSRSLRDVAFLWHLLTVDDRVVSTNLDNFAKNTDGANFSFEGDLNFEYFLQKEKDDIDSVSGVNIIMYK